MVTFAGKKFLRFLSKLLSLLFESFATKTAKVRKGHFWTILYKFHVFLIFRGLNEKSFGHSFYANVPLKILKLRKYLVWKSISNCA